MQLKELNVVAIGGGHGLGRVLSTLSFLGNQLTGIVTTTDNGGSTGRLRKRSSSIAWGDLRNCLTQLVDPDSLGSQLFNYRFNSQSEYDELDGHNLGNLLLYGLGDIQSRPLDSIKLVRRLLRVKTSVLPMSEEPTDLMAFYDKGLCKVGEISVDNMQIMPKKLMLAPLVKSMPDCINAILNADLIIIGPGSFLTSVIPPLLIKDINHALKNAKAHRIFIDNITPERSPAGQLTLDEKLIWIKKNIGFIPIDSAICHDNQMFSNLVSVYHHELQSDKNVYYHSRDKLISALNGCISNAKKLENITQDTA